MNLEFQKFRRGDRVRWRGSEAVVVSVFLDRNDKNILYAVQSDSDGMVIVTFAEDLTPNGT